MKTTTTKHTCNDGDGPIFGRRTAGCPRCDELAAGAPPREAPPRIQAIQRLKQQDAARSADMKRHFAPGGPHAQGACGPVCTAFDW